MDVQKMPTLAEKQEFWAEQLPNFEATYWLPSHFEYVIFDMEQGNYVIKDDLSPDFEGDATEIWHRVNTGWAMWKKAINFGRKQAQSIPESFEQAYSEIFSPIVKRPYPRLENGDYKYIEIDQGWKLWQAATSQAVLEKDAIIQKLSDQLYAQEMKTSGARVLYETACELLDGYAHQDAMVIINDLEQAMKEPAND